MPQAGEVMVVRIALYCWPAPSPEPGGLAP